jgi:hypothetical protein
MKKTAALLIAVGAIVIVLTVFPFVFTTNKKIVDVGDLEIRQRESHSLPWKPIVGIAIVAVGIGVYLLSLKRPIVRG